MQRPLKNASFVSTFNDYDTFDLDGLPHPAQAFEHPSHVVTDPDLTLNEKRAILRRGRRVLVRSKRLQLSGECQGANVRSASTK